MGSRHSEGSSEGLAEVTSASPQGLPWPAGVQPFRPATYVEISRWDWPLFDQMVVLRWRGIVNRTVNAATLATWPAQAEWALTYRPTCVETQGKLRRLFAPLSEGQKGVK
jgi:hypothetical protein